MSRGKFITFEGLDGCGKSTQLNRLAEVLRADGIDVITAREPGTTPIGEQIRGILLNSRTIGLAPLAELALMFAARAQLVREVIEPALAEGKFVLVDRYTDSSEAYQGGGRELGSETVLAVHKAVARLNPDMTVLMDSEVSASVARARRRNQQATAKNGATSDENRFERENARFFDRVHRAYLNIAKREPERVYMVDARRDPDTVHGEIVKEVRKRLGIGEVK